MVGPVSSCKKGRDFGCTVQYTLCSLSRTILGRHWQRSNRRLNSIPTARTGRAGPRQLHSAPPAFLEIKKARPKSCFLWRVICWTYFRPAHKTAIAKWMGSQFREGKLVPTVRTDIAARSGAFELATAGDFF